MKRVLVLATALMTATLTAAQELPSPADALQGARRDAAGMGCPAGAPVSQAPAVLAPGWTVKTKLDRQELDKLIAWAKYAHSKKNDKITYGFFNLFSLQPVGKLQDDGSLSLSQILLTAEGPSYNAPLKPGYVRGGDDQHVITVNLDGTFDYKVENDAQDLRTQASQEMIQAVIGYWISTKIPN